jgi:hypothetical protein
MPVTLTLKDTGVRVRVSSRSGGSLDEAEWLLHITLMTFLCWPCELAKQKAGQAECKG